MLTSVELLLATFAGLSSAVAIHYCFLCSRLARTCLDLRQALRERDAAGREPERVAFQSGYQVGLRAAGEAVEIETACDCQQCRSERWAVN